MRLVVVLKRTICAPISEGIPYRVALYGHAWISPLDCAFPTSRIGAFGAFIQHYDP